MNMSSCPHRLISVGIIFAATITAAADVPIPTLVPAVKSVQWKRESATNVRPGSAAIVVGARATAPERAAADMLQRYVARRFNANWPVLTEDEETSSHATMMEACRQMRSATGSSGVRPSA